MTAANPIGVQPAGRDEHRASGVSCDLSRVIARYTLTALRIFRITPAMGANRCEPLPA